MEPIVYVVLAWALFAVTHIGMATASVREPIVAHLGRTGFTAIFSIVAAVTFSVLVNTYSNVQGSGPAGLALGGNPLFLWPLVALSTLGIVCIAGSLLDYPTSAYAISVAGQKTEPQGFERITRHGFNVGMAMVATAHALLSTRMTGTVFFGVLAVFAILGSIHQDAKLRARNPSLHGPYLDATSLVPFAAILSGRGRLVVSELRPSALVLGLFAAWILREAHPHLFASGGLYVIVAVLGGAVLAGVQDLMVNRKSRRRPRRESMGDDALPRGSR
jgi:uncharacterized membrane protein